MKEGLDFLRKLLCWEFSFDKSEISGIFDVNFNCNAVNEIYFILFACRQSSSILQITFSIAKRKDHSVIALICNNTIYYII